MTNEVVLMGEYRMDSTSPQGKRYLPVAVDGKGRLRVNVEYDGLADALSSMTSQSPSFLGLTLSGLTASQLVATNASKGLVSVQGAAVADATLDLTSVKTQLNAALAQLRAIGAFAT